MAIAASGAVSMSDLRTEFVGGSAALSFSDLYRGGSHIRQKAANNTSTNLAASVPTSGAINYTNFRSTAKGFRKTYTSGATNQDASSVFGSDYGVNYPKEIVINSGVELGATSTSQEALQIDSGLSGSMTITNNGTLSGAGGSAGGGAGGDAFEANVACTLINNGTIRAGGGGGGNGGNGGNGGTGGGGVFTSIGGWSGDQSSLYGGGYPCLYGWVIHYNVIIRIYWCGDPHIYDSGNIGSGAAGSRTQQVVGSYRYEKRAFSWNESCCGNSWYAIRRRSESTVNTNGGAGGGGGAGGAGGRGQGYNHGNQNGSGGSAGAGGAGGGTNAGAGGQGGTGGTGGNGGTYGNSGGNGSGGATGNTGAGGNRTGGFAGSGGLGGASGSAAGKYIRGLSNVTFTNNGTVQGGTA